MTVYSEYYKRFRCIADRCKHNCCIGWEIDIDEDTARYYAQVTGDFGKRLKESISQNDGIFSFRLREDERCPFLSDKNLCTVIEELGEDALCEICRMHPRYRNFYSEREELGLGLCCEEAARIVLTETDKMHLVTEAGDVPEDAACEEREFFKLRDWIFTRLQERDKPLSVRAGEIAAKLSLPADIRSLDAWKEIFASLECLDPNWPKVLSSIAPCDWKKEDEAVRVPAEQLISAFVYRHFAKVLDGESYVAVLSFCFLSLRVICALWNAHKRRTGALKVEDMVELARMYSAEIEYSPENTEALLRVFEG